MGNNVDQPMGFCGRNGAAIRSPGERADPIAPATGRFGRNGLSRSMVSFEKRMALRARASRSVAGEWSGLEPK